MLKRLAAMRAFKREENSSVSLDHAAEAVGMTPQQVDDMYRLLAIADYDDRYVIPQAHRELAGRLSVSAFNLFLVNLAGDSLGGKLGEVALPRGEP